MTDVADEIARAFTLDGFMYQARHLVFDELAAARLIASIEKIGPEPDLNVRDAILSVLWQIPFLALLWEEQCVKEGASKRKYRKTVGILRDLVAKKTELLLSPPSGAFVPSDTATPL